MQSVVEKDPYVSLVESNIRFTRASIQGQNTLLSTLYVQPRQGQDVAAQSTSRRLTKEIQTELLSEGFNVTPLVSITLLEPPE